MILYLTVLMILIIASIYDYKYQEIPNILSLLLIILGLIFNYNSMHTALIGVIVGVIPFFIVNLATQSEDGQLAIGGGDVKIMAGIGACVGVMNSILIVRLTCITALIYMIIRKKKGTILVPFITFSYIVVIIQGFI